MTAIKEITISADDSILNYLSETDEALSWPIADDPKQRELVGEHEISLKITFMSGVPFTNKFISTLKDACYETDMNEIQILGITNMEDSIAVEEGTPVQLLVEKHSS